MEAKNNFQVLYDIDVREKTKQKNGLNYLSWASCWAEVKKIFPEATFEIKQQIVEIKDGIVTQSRPWFVDNMTNTAWVDVCVTIGGITYEEILPIMDFRNQSILADKIKSTDANKSIQRALTKACARAGLGLYLYEGEDMPEETKNEEKKKAEVAKSELEEWNAKCYEAAKIASKIDNETTGKLCKKYVANGNPKRITDIESSKDLYSKLQEIINKGEKA